MTRIAWWHAAAGASGDMCLGALVDAGVALETVQAAVDAIGVDPIGLSVESVTRQGIGATRVVVSAPRTSVVRTWGNVRRLLESAALDEPVRGTSLAVFERLAKAEAQVHRSSPESVRFHEVGALDAIADVVGTAAGLHALGVGAVHASPIAVGLGMSRGEHGLVPVPGPAVLALLGDAGAPAYSGDVPYELTTPTGAAILAATVTQWGGLPPMRVRATGYGAGSRDLDELPNVLRLVIGDSADAPPPAGTALVLEANVDDLDPRLWPAVLTRLLEAGAADAWLTPILMKKGRPAHTLSVLVDDAQAETIRGIVFTETSTIGLREARVAKRPLDRSSETVTVDGQPIRVKVARLGEVAVNASPEYEDVVAAAAALGRPIKAVLAAAVAAVHDAGLDR
ncbi:MAG TPA: nickel pincer cofactor biosynthesis protein LarC [Mycobacteriales bacterium]|nr:nickel pincer cofactor biosynthesis protein LarC [Mycobacteriales bacterium]